MDLKLQELERIARSSLSEGDIANLGHAIRRTFGQKPPKKELNVVFDEVNNSYVTSTWWGDKRTVKYVSNSIFFDCLKFVSYSQLRGGIEATFISILDGIKYKMWGKEFKKTIPHMIHGTVMGWWTFSNRAGRIKLSNDSIVRLR